MSRKIVVTVAVFLALAACGDGRQDQESGPATAGTLSPQELTEVGQIELPTPVTPPSGFQELQTEVGGLSLTYPEEWLLVDGFSGQSAIFQSFPKGAAGTDGIPAGETKCDFILREDVTTVEQAVASIAAGAGTEVLSEERITSSGGVELTLIEAQSSRTGEFRVALTSNNDQVIMLSCIGDMEMFEEIAGSIFKLD